MDKAPEAFDWVTARSRCSAVHMFALLVETVEADVAAMTALAPGGFRLNRPVATKIIVARVGDTGDSVDAIVLERTATGVQVRESKPDAKALFVAKVMLGPDGRCRYEFDGQPMEPWQISRKALEDLFFQ